MCCDPVGIGMGYWEKAQAGDETVESWYDIAFIHDHMHLDPDQSRADPGGVALQCDFYDHETRQCGAYDRRPQMCKAFPKQHLNGPTSVWFVERFPHCSYIEAIPIELRRTRG